MTSVSHRPCGTGYPGARQYVSSGAFWQALAMLRKWIGGAAGRLPAASVGLVLGIGALTFAGCGGPSPGRSTSATTRPTAPTTAEATTSTTSPSTSTTSPTTSTLGLTGAWFEGSGFGEVEPSQVYLGGDPTGRLTSINWSSWGGAEATGSGSGWYVPPNTITADGSDQPATVIAFDLGTCADHSAYQEVEWYFAGEGGTFDPTQALYACTKGYVNEGTQAMTYSPWATSTSLFGDITPVNTLSGGSCSGASAFDVNDQFAWRCTVQSGALYDPCFAPEANTSVADVTEVACADSPWSGVTLIKLSQPLSSSSWGTPTDNLRHPWALQLVNGDQCGLIEGTGSVVGGVTLNFGCTYGDAAYPSENVEPWTTQYSLNHSEVVTASSVATAWK